MTKETDPKVLLEGADELHIKDVGVFFIKDKKAYYKNGRPVEDGKLFVCQHCETSPPFVATKEIDFAEHMIDKHPEYAKGKTPEAKTELLSLDQMTKEELLTVAEEENLDVDKRLNKAELLAEIRAKMPVSNNPKYI